MIDHGIINVHPARARRRARRIDRARLEASRGALRWIFPGLALAAPLTGEAAGGYLLGCLLFGAVFALWSARRTGAVWSVMAWSTVTGVFSSALVLIEVPANPSLTLATLVTALVQALSNPPVRAAFR